MVNNVFQEWRCFGKSVLGASHISKNLPNQDAIKISSSQNLPIILAVSDGHGSAKSFRSDRGSKLAVKTAITVIEDLLPNLNNLEAQLSNSEIINLVENEFPRKIVYKWQQAVDKDLLKSPIKSTEWDALEKQEGENAKQLVVDNPKIVYGATVLSVVVTELSICYWQLGDGDILCIDEARNVTRPLPPDDRLLANETTSLCMKDAWKNFRSQREFYPAGTTKEKPVLILASTDGYANSYASEEDFCELAREHLDDIRKEGVEKKEQELSQHLEEVSTKGSGDDITLGMIRQIETSDRDSQIMLIKQEVQKNHEDLKKKITKFKTRSTIALTIAIASLLANVASGIGWFELYQQNFSTLEKIQQLEKKQIKPDNSAKPNSNPSQTNNNDRVEQKTSKPPASKPSDTANENKKGKNPEKNR